MLWSCSTLLWTRDASRCRVNSTTSDNYTVLEVNPFNTEGRRPNSGLVVRVFVTLLRSAWKIQDSLYPLGLLWVRLGPWRSNSQWYRIHSTTVTALSLDLQVPNLGNTGWSKFYRCVSMEYECYPFWRTWQCGMLHLFDVRTLCRTSKCIYQLATAAMGTFKSPLCSLVYIPNSELMASVFIHIGTNTVDKLCGDSMRGTWCSILPIQIVYVNYEVL